MFVFFKGALKATNNAGLQPAMDHILENDGKPVPDLTSVTSTSAPSAQANDEQDDEELEALRAQYGGGAAATPAGGSASGGVAQVRSFMRIHSTLR